MKTARNALILFFVLATAAPASAVTTLTMRPQATVRDAVIRLTVVADVAGDGHERLAEVYLQKAPAEGESVIIDREAIRARLRLVGVRRNDIAFKGAEAVRVTRAEKSTFKGPELLTLPDSMPSLNKGNASAITQAASDTNTSKDSTVSNTDHHSNIQTSTTELSKNQNETDVYRDGIRQAAEQYLREVIGNAEVRITLETISIDFDAAQARQASGILVEQGPSGRLSGRIDFRFAFLDKNRQRLGVVEAVFNAEISAPVLISRNTLRRGDAITADMLMREYRPLNGNERYVADPKSILGKRATRTIQARTAIAVSDVESVPDVERNQLVTIVGSVGSFHIKAIGRAQERGQMGDLIMVLNMDSGQKFAARISGPGTVSVTQ